MSNGITTLLQRPPHIKTGRKDSWSGLNELWLEISIDCPLRCSYCFNSAGDIRHEHNTLTEENYLDILEQFRNLGGKTVGLPGAGEPLFGKNTQLTLKIADYCSKNDMHLVIFTSGLTLNDTLIEQLNQPHISLMLKYNSADEQKQDALVGVKGYTKRRAENIEKLIRAGFTSDHRLALVNSIMSGNYDEIPSIYRYCRDNNIIPDFDTLLEKGNGYSCKLKEQDQKAKEMFEQLKHIDETEYSYTWQISPTYVGGKCDRHDRHVYVNRFGDVSPCLGIKDNIRIGNLKQHTLESIWQRNPLMQKIKQREYTGKCTICAHYQDNGCNSCLGRYANVNQAENSITTIGCWNYAEQKKD